MARGAISRSTSHATGPHPKPAGFEDFTSSDFPVPRGNPTPDNVIGTTDTVGQGSHFFARGAILGARPRLDWRTHANPRHARSPDPIGGR